MKWKEIRLTVEMVSSGRSSILLNEFANLRDVGGRQNGAMNLAIYHRKDDPSNQLFLFPPVDWAPYNDLLRKFGAVEIDDPRPEEIFAVWGVPESSV
jgi:hypothetical protein